MFFLLKSLFEDSEYSHQPNCIYFNTRVIRITETLLYANRLYSGFDVPPNAQIKIGIRHGGLKNRVLSAVGGRIFPLNYKSVEDEVYTEVETTLDKIKPEMVGLVGEFTEQLFIVFDFFKLERNILEDIVNNYIKGKIV